MLFDDKLSPKEQRINSKNEERLALKILSHLYIIFFVFVGTFGIPIETPDTDERNDFVIRCPYGWGYRTFKGENGLIGVFWPKGTSFNLTDTAIFVFLRDKSKHHPTKLDNIHLFEEKCTKARFKIPKEVEDRNPTKSLGEKYFRGRCGRTMIIIEESIGNYNVVLLLASAKRYITKKQLADFKDIAIAYRREAEDCIKSKELENFEDEEDLGTEDLGGDRDNEYLNA